MTLLITTVYIHVPDRSNGQSRSDNQNQTDSTHLCELTSHDGIVVSLAQHRRHRPAPSILAAAFPTPLTINISSTFTNITNPFREISAGTPPWLPSSTQIDNPAALHTTYTRLEDDSWMGNMKM